MTRPSMQSKLIWYVSTGLAVCVTWLGGGLVDGYARGPGVIPASATELTDQPDRFLAFGTAQDSLYWRISQFNAANLDPDTPDNHAWWCGSWFPIGCPGDLPEGYGNDWDQWLVWTPFVVEDPTQPVSVRVTARLNHDSEPYWDFLYLECERIIGWWEIAAYDGMSQGVDVDVVYTVPAGELVGPDGDQLNLRWRFVSDSYMSDED